MKKQVLAAPSFSFWLARPLMAPSYIAPTKRTMGPIQRIFYFHVASAWTGLTGVLHLLRRQSSVCVSPPAAMGLAQRFRR